MNATDYQQEAVRTLISEPDTTFTGTEQMLMWCALGLGGEAGEVLDHLKKGICHQHGLDRNKLTEELGDLMWYVAAICELADIPLGLVMERNIAKLHKRYPNGYNSVDSKARVDVGIQISQYCENCHLPIDNLTGIFVLAGQHGQYLAVGTCCRDDLMRSEYWSEMARGKGVDTVEYQPTENDQQICWNCEQPINNLTGIHIMRHAVRGLVQVGSCCYHEMLDNGWQDHARARGIDYRPTIH